MPEAISGVASPKFEKPSWYQKQIEAEKAKTRVIKTSKPTSSVVTYTVSAKGSVSSSLAEFSQQVNQTLNDSRGWAQLGVSFREVSNGGRFNLILSEASLLPSFSSGCDVEWSCRVGASVIINDKRWSSASQAWNSSGGSLRDYRHMVINHEVGHWLGHGHRNCSAGGQLAPIMQQQSMNLQGCSFNPWPLTSELWSTQLGIR